MYVKLVSIFIVAIFGVCLGEFVETPDKLYFASKEALNWTEAKKACEKAGLELVSLLNENDKAALESFLKEYKLAPQDAWTGYWLAGIRHPDGKFYWDTTGTKVGEGLSDWLVGEPSNAYFKEHCIELKQGFNQMGWNDYFCVEARKYLCQVPRAEGPRGEGLRDYSFLAEENRLNERPSYRVPVPFDNGIIYLDASEIFNVKPF
ncbi:salivary C-type lectin 2-like [Rhynchophorus ferrugineus]|uniref:salivary C-type lectin 2-like n=1 Tax=Rhynchophorus ferrugineus TaxID=354439 RepID=UPI003FCE7189